MSDPRSLSDADLMAQLGLPSAPAFGVGQTGPTGSNPTPVQRSPLPPLSGDVTTGSQGEATNLGNLTDDQIKAYLGLHEPSMSMGEDVARTLPGAAARAGSALVGLPGDALNLATNAVPFLYHEGKAALLSPTGMDAADKANPYQPYNYAGMIGLPTSEQVNGGVQALAGGYHKPQTWEARTADTAIQMAPMAALPGSALARAIRVAAPTIGSEAAGEATQGTPYEPYARVGGAVLGGGVAHLGDQIVNAPNIMLANALKGSTAAEASQARAAMESAQGVGVPITPMEAMGGNALRLQNYIENQRRLPTGVDQFFAQRPGQVSSAVQNFADQIAPPSSQPSMIGLSAQGAAQGGLDTVRRVINGYAKPSYDALVGQEIPQADFQGLLQDPSYQKALQTLRSDPELNAPIAHLPDNNLAVVNATQKQLDTLQSGARQTELNPGGNNEVAMRRGLAKALADQLARKASPNYADAHDIVSQGRTALLDPLQAGPAGDIASTPSLKAQTGALFPTAPAEGGANESVQAARLLQSQDPQVAADLTRQHVMNSFNEASQDLQGGQNQYGGARWVAQTAGNPEQRATLEQVLGVVNPDLSQPYADLADALRATGRRTQPGSQTAFNQEMAQAMHTTPAPARFLAGALDPLEWGRHLDNAVGGALYRRNINSLSHFMTQMSPADAEAFINAAIKRGTQQAPMAAQVPLQISAGNQQ